MWRRSQKKSEKALAVILNVIAPDGPNKASKQGFGVDGCVKLACAKALQAYLVTYAGATKKA